MQNTTSQPNAAAAAAKQAAKQITETGEHRDFRDDNNNHRITVVRMSSGHIGLAFAPMPDREGYTYRPLPARVEIVTPYPLTGALPTWDEVHGMWMARKRD